MWVCVSIGLFSNRKSMWCTKPNHLIVPVTMSICLCSCVCVSEIAKWVGITSIFKFLFVWNSFQNTLQSLLQPFILYSQTDMCICSIFVDFNTIQNALIAMSKRNSSVENVNFAKRARFVCLFVGLMVWWFVRLFCNAHLSMFSIESSPFFLGFMLSIHFTFIPIMRGHDKTIFQQQQHQQQTL